jgi:hypothetical protein
MAADTLFLVEDEGAAGGIARDYRLDGTPNRERQE